MAREYANKQPKGFKNKIENVAIVGAGGHCGVYIVGELLKLGKHKVTAISRTGSTSKIPEGVAVNYVDYDDHSSLVKGLVGQDALIITMSVTAPPEQQTKLIEAAAEANVEWIVPNVFGVDTANEEAGKDIMLGPAKQKELDLIKKLGKSSWVGVVCGFWYEYSLGIAKYSFGFDFQNKTVTFYGDGTTRVNTSTLDQTGRATANLLGLKLLPDDENDKSPCLADFKNKYLYVSSFTVNQKEMLESLLRVSGDSPDDWKVTHVPVKERYEEGVKMLKSGNRAGFMQLLYARPFYPDGFGLHEKTRGLDNDKLGLPREDLDEYTKVSLDLFKDENGHFARYQSQFKE